MEELLVLLLCAASLTDAQTPSEKTFVDRETRRGAIRGYRENVLGRDVDIFLGIPFAHPPVGDLRFRAPETYGMWSGMLNATSLPNACPQMPDDTFDGYEGFTMWNPNTNISEDCLYLNIWAPSNSSGLPVMVWIYGGGFTSGTSTLSLYDGRILASKGDVVVVSMQYRTAAFGFLFLDTFEAPGNMGLLDQQMALRWTKNEIDEYGGDNTRITLFGESAGASSSSLHLLSPRSQEYFNNAIMQSGSAFAHWAVDPPDVAKERSLALARSVGCYEDGTDIQEVVWCMRKVKHELLSESIFHIPPRSQASPLRVPLVPTVDEEFLPEDPLDILADGKHKKTSILLGTNKDEGVYFLFYGLPDIFNSVQLTRNLTRDEYLQSIRDSFHSKDKSLVQTVAFEYEQPYQFTDKITYVDSLDDIYGDYCFVCPVVDFAMFYAQDNQDVYMYRFLHKTSQNNPFPDWTGAMHGYEIDHVFGLPLNRSQGYRGEEAELSQSMITYWTNFAKTGDPNQGVPAEVAWPKYDVSSRQYLALDVPRLSVHQGVRDRKCAFWRDLYPVLRKAGEKGNGNPGSDETCGCDSRLHWASAATLLLFTSILSIITPSHV